MNNKRMNIFHPTTSKSGIFLLELIIVILFFSIASTICIEMFVKSYTLSNDSKHLNKSIQISENIAEVFKNSTDIKEISSMDTYFYDKNGSPSTDVSYTYLALIYYSSNKEIQIANIEIYTDDTLLYALQIDKYIPERSMINEK